MTEAGAWEDWIAYFLRGIRLQAYDALARIERLDILFDSRREGPRRGAIASARRGPELVRGVPVPDRRRCR